jgi:hypothetical protein
MGPPLATFGLLSPRQIRGPIPNRWAHPSGAATTLKTPLAWWRLIGREFGNTSRDGVAHEAPLSTVWRVCDLAATEHQTHTFTATRMDLGAPLAQRTATPPAE